MFLRSVIEKHLTYCVGFIGCTKIRMARPGRHCSLQISVYSVHKRLHYIIFKTIRTPNGLMFSFYGAEVGIWHDKTVLRLSSWNKNYVTESYN